jgi:hypothetical protein
MAITRPDRPDVAAPPDSPTQRALHRARAFWRGEGRWAASITPVAIRAPQNADLPARVPATLVGLRAQRDLPGINLPCFYPDFGTVSQARYFGGQVQVGEGGLLYMPPITDSLDEALALAHAPVDDPRQDAAIAIDLFHQAQARLGPGMELWHRTVDAQGPLSTAGQILQQECLFMAMLDDGPRVERYLDRITTFLIDLWRYQRVASGGRIAGSIWPYTVLPAEIGVSFTEDMMPLLSPEQYEALGIPTLRRVQDHFGGLHIHCCGQWGRHVPALLRSGLKLLAYEFHHPYTTFDELRPLAESGVVLVPYLAVDKQRQYRDSREFYRDLLTRAPRARFWFCLSDPLDEAVALYHELERDFGPGA